jgi:DMSO reductase anchor subunit
MTSRTFHERPLVIFTALAILGAGLLTAPLAALVPAAASYVASGTFGLTTLLGTLLLAAGLLISLSHLGRPLRSPLALARVGRSRLSSEIAAVSVTLISALVILLVPGLPPAAALVPAVLALVFLVTLGRVYDLPGQDAWRGLVAWTPLTLGVSVGALAACAAGGSAVFAWAAVVADSSVIAISTGMQRRAGTPATTHGRILLADIVPAVLLAAGLPIPALVVLALGVVADRLSFYLHASQHTTEAEIAQIEALMENY